MLLRKLLVVSTLLYSISGAAQTFDITLSNDTAKLSYFSPLGNKGFGRGEFEGTLLYNDDENLLGALGVHVVDEAGAGAPGLSAGVGVKGYFVKMEHDDAIAITVGGQFTYALPVLSSRLKLGGGLNYAPSITTFMDADRFLELNARIGYEVLPDAVVYIGYRKIKVGIDEGSNVTVDDGGHLGVNFRF